MRTAIGDPAAAAAARERLFDESDEWATSWLAPECRHLLALADRAGDADPVPTCAALREALETAHRQDARLLALRIAETLGEVLLEARRPRDALTLLRAERSALPRAVVACPCGTAREGCSRARGRRSSPSPG